MTYRRVIENYYSDVNNLLDALGKLTLNYRTLIGGADELSKSVIASKSDVKKALDRADNIGDIIDIVIDDLDKYMAYYLKYCKSKMEVIKNYNREDYIVREIDEELKI
ncbi:hypothetical protein SAMN02745248_01341 [Hathewaya proteolytica DSM 3090]|uniref:LXG domain of WXG superfamily protein n=1 Tax=Hathewaya proteolytica DSM 3090 TaxID=1121331 RepID=A0A1M6NA99_9CLOT|nr:hypothetical protein [Hathewaya proteolytica]SHJ92602.1 hypothetical protein SAMN02745248_01341 [Hathewaya proteolytica DSM 3090]